MNNESIIETAVTEGFKLGLQQGILCSMRRLLELQEAYGLKTLGDAAEFIELNKDIITRYGLEDINLQGQSENNEAAELIPSEPS